MFESERNELLEKTQKTQVSSLRSTTMKLIVVAVLITITTLLLWNRGQPPAEPEMIIPSFTEPKGTIFETVYYAHYLSRLVGTDKGGDSKMTALSGLMKKYRDDKAKDLTNSDSGTLDSLIALTEFYTEYASGDRMTGWRANFWQKIMAVVRLLPEDVAEESLGEIDSADSVSISDNILWKEQQKRLNQIRQAKWLTARTSKVREYEEEFNTISSSALSGEIDSITLEKLISRTLTAIKNGEELESDNKNLIAFSSFLNHNQVQMDPTSFSSPAQSFLNFFESSRLLLPLSSEDHLFSRVLEMLIVGWSNYVYVTPERAHKTIEAIKSGSLDERLANEIQEFTAKYCSGSSCSRMYTEAAEAAWRS